MHKCIAFSWLLLTLCTVQAQKIGDVKKLIEKEEYKQAREVMVKLLQNPKSTTDPETWYYKGIVWNGCSKDSSLPIAECYVLKKEAFEAFKAYQQLDKKDALMLMEMHRSYFDLYFGFYNMGVMAYQQKNYTTSLNSFVKTSDVTDYIQEHEYTNESVQLSKMDTSLITNIVITALQSDSLEIGVRYYAKLADAGMRTKDMHELAESFLSNTIKSGDEKSFQSVLKQAKQLFPNEELWLEYELKFVEKNLDKASMYATYEEIIRTNPTLFLLNYNYCVELYNAIHVDKAEKPVYPADVLRNKFIQYIENGIKNEPKDGVMARLLLNRHLYNDYADINQNISQIKGSKPQDLATKKELKTKREELIRAIIQNLENAAVVLDNIPKRTAVQKGNYKVILQVMMEMYKETKNLAKQNECTQKNIQLDKE